MRDLPEGWIETTLGKLVVIKYGKDHKHLADGDYPLYGSGGIMRHVEKPLYDKESILIPRKGTLSNLFYIDEPFWSVDTIFYTEIDMEKVKPLFLFYKLKTIDLAGLNVGSAVPSLTTKVLNPLELSIPPLPEQKAIADMLSSLDDKIELLREQNKTLETLAQTIFKEWFVHFNFPDPHGKPYRNNGGAMVASELGLIPQGWRVGSLLEVFDLIGGGTPKTSVDEYWNGGIPWYSVVDAPKGSDTFVIDTEKKISAFGLEKSSTKLLRKGTTIVSARGTVGKLALVGREAAMNQSCYGIQGKGYFGDYYVYFQIKEALNSLKSRVHGAVFDTITQSTFKNIMVPLPDDVVVVSYEKIVTPIMEKILNNVFQIQILSKTRDTLLPKLMIGNLRVSVT